MTRALPCLCLALFTLACQNQPADTGKPAPAKAATPAAPAKADPHAAPGAHGPANPHAVDPHAGVPGMTSGAVAQRVPVNPTPVTPSGKVRAEGVAELSVSVPEEWVRKPPANPMRLTEFTLPGPGGEVNLVVSRFAGGGGDAASNVNRWRTQLMKPDGAPLAESDVKQKTIDRAPLKITVVDIEGTNVAPVTPTAAERFNEPDSRLLGLIVEGSGDPIFFKAVGPSTTVSVWADAWNKVAESIAAGAPAKDAAGAPADAPAKKK